MGIIGGSTAGFSMESAKLGKKGLAEGLRPDPGAARCVDDGGEEGLRTGDACGGNFFSPGEVGLLTEEEEDEDRDFLDCFWVDFASLCSLGWNSCAVVLGERRGAGLGVSKDSPRGRRLLAGLASPKSNSSLLLLIWESFRSHEASEGERGGAEATTWLFGERPGLGWEGGLKAEVSPSGMPCTQESWRELVMSNIPLSTMSPPVASFSREKGGEKAWLLLPKLAFSVSLKRSN